MTVLKANTVETEMLVRVLLLLKLPYDVVRVDVQGPSGLLLDKSMPLSNGAVAEGGVLIALPVVGELLLLETDESGSGVLALDESTLT